MPDAWSDKDERQYQHVKDSELKEGRPAQRAEEISARTVNKQRRQQGRTAGQRRPESSPDTALSALRRDELYARAQQEQLRGRSRMSKAELIKALEASEKERG